MSITALWTQGGQGCLEHKEVLVILATGPATPCNVLGEFLRLLRSRELRVIWKSNVDQASDGSNLGAGRVKLCVIDAIAINLSNPKVLLDLYHFRSFDAVCCTPDVIFHRSMLAMSDRGLRAGMSMRVRT